MTTSAPLLTHENVIEFWRRRFRRQRHVNAGVRSLLRKYGSSTSIPATATDFLLTLMGNLVTADTCFYRSSADERLLIPMVAFGSTALEELPPISFDSVLAQIAREGGPPRLLNSLPRSATDEPTLGPVRTCFKLFAPLQFENRLEGVVFLGGKVTGAAFTDNDVELIEALCAVTAAVLRYMQRERMAAVPEELSARALIRCQELAAAIAGHMQRSLKTIEELSSPVAPDGDIRERLAQVSVQAESMRYLLTSLRQMANDPAALTDQEASERYDAAETIQSAVLALRKSFGDDSVAISFRHELDDQQNLVSIDRITLRTAVGETLYALTQQCTSAELFAVHIDRTRGLPTGIGPAPAAANEAPRPMLRVRLEARSSGAGDATRAAGMKMLADNLEAFQTVRDPAPAQSALIAAGGTIVWRHEHDTTTYLVYLPLASV